VEAFKRGGVATDPEGEYKSAGFRMAMQGFLPRLEAVLCPFL
jgi:hypothetical protein